MFFFKIIMHEAHDTGPLLRNPRPSSSLRAVASNADFIVLLIFWNFVAKFRDVFARMITLHIRFTMIILGLILIIY